MLNKMYVSGAWKIFIKNKSGYAVKDGILIPFHCFYDCVSIIDNYDHMPYYVKKKISKIFDKSITVGRFHA